MAALDSRRMVIAGASSLLGRELKSVLEESRFAASDLRLVDEESFAGSLTEAGGEPAVIQPVEPDSFAKAAAIFFTGSASFTNTNLELARASRAYVIDLSGALAGNTESKSWIPDVNGDNADAASRLFAIPSAHAEIVARLAAALRSFQAAISAVAFQPVSVAGTAGVEELESQTGQLLSFQPPGKVVFDTQVAFNMLDRFGAASRHNMSQSLQALRSDIRACLAPETPMPAVQLLHAP